MSTQIERSFTDRFGRDPEFTFFAPGRVNLIGEHIDYCGGLVLPMAIDSGTFGAAARNPSGRVTIFSTRFGESASFDMSALPGVPSGQWIDYAVGIARLLELDPRTGVDLLIDANIGAGGLSSSASFIAVAAFALLCTEGRAPAVGDVAARIELARLCRRAENEFVGVPCGIMDQASVILGGTLKLDCATLEFERIDADFGEYKLVIMDTGKERSLAASAYNRRVEETGVLRAALQEALGIRELCELAPGRLQEAMAPLGDATLKKRLRHVVTEQHRVIRAAEALGNGELALFGELMNESHESLRSDFEVTGRELDTIVAASRAQEGVLGARMTGAGFGGCAIALVHRDAVSDHSRRATERYRRQTGLAPRFIVAAPSAGAQLL